MIEQGIKNGIGMFVFDAKSNYNKHIPYYAEKYGRIQRTQVFRLGGREAEPDLQPGLQGEAGRGIQRPDEIHLLRACEPGILSGPGRRRLEQPDQPSFQGVQARHPDGLSKPHFQRDPVLQDHRVFKQTSTRTRFREGTSWKSGLRCPRRTGSLTFRGSPANYPGSPTGNGHPSSTP